MLRRYAQHYTHAIDWSNLATVRTMLEESHAFDDGEDAKLKVDWAKWVDAKSGG
jgi:hypothetical protein